MTEFHPLPSLYDKNQRMSKEWMALNQKAETLAKSIPIAKMPSLDHIDNNHHHERRDYNYVYEPSDDTVRNNSNNMKQKIKNTKECHDVCVSVECYYFSNHQLFCIV